MAAALVLAFFLILGLSVVFVAMRGGPRGLRDTLEAGRKRPLHVAEFVVAGVIALFGIAVPAIVLLGDQASAGPGGTTLNADLAQGRIDFTAKCATCHTLGDANAVGRVGPNLDELAPTAGLTVSAIREGRARGAGQMPAQLLDGADARNVAKYIERVAGS
ncbi:MAG TPA: cytochrome c [Solirubrobacteraceae bacterium]|nr:cytochrome c [Solirubrobacteraceae bacterium]